MIPSSGRRVRVRGLVQGVGFRPHVWRLARALGLAGWVRNDAQGVDMAVYGEEILLELFLQRLSREAPSPARIDAVEARETPPVPGLSGFRILESLAGAAATAIGPDIALCDACIADLCDPANRRWRYALTTCAHCGPRYTVSHGIPYDRARTSLFPFPLCPACQAEYDDPANRRFHAETTGCPDCGPHLRFLGPRGEAPGDPLAAALDSLLSGKILAVKGLGGFHLVCDANNAPAVARLRERKSREEKPFAVMGLNTASLAAWAQIGPEEAALLRSPAAPIVLCPQIGAELPGIAPGLSSLGLMLPSTPLHLLLWHEAAGRPAGTDWLAAHSPLLWVMTSANPHGEPLVTGNDEALQRLGGIADAFLIHDREIVVRCDDSVVRPARTGALTFLRRARGYAPLPIPLSEDGPTVLAFGAYLKNTLCLLKGREAFLSQHIGGLDNAATRNFLEDSARHLLRIFDVQPDLVAHDLHPDDPATRLAQEFAARHGIPAVAVGHHHAHLAAIAAEHGHAGPLLGLAIDGLGLGSDGGLWGGECLYLDEGGCKRLGQLRPLALPGGDQAAREPWRMAVSALYAAGQANRIESWLARRHPGRSARVLLSMLERGFRTPATSSLGRAFDAAAGLLGIRSTSSYEAQAAMELESLAARHGPVAPLPGGARLTPEGLDFTPLFLALADCDKPAYGAALFHATLARELTRWILEIARHDPTIPGKKIKTLACGGGCATNAVLMEALGAQLAAAGISLLEARLTPPNDGGLALGQARVGRERLHGKEKEGRVKPSLGSE